MFGRPSRSIGYSQEKFNTPPRWISSFTRKISLKEQLEEALAEISRDDEKCSTGTSLMADKADQITERISKIGYEDAGSCRGRVWSIFGVEV
jgi:hypothetical protein